MLSFSLLTKNKLNSKTIKHTEDFFNFKFEKLSRNTFSAYDYKNDIKINLNKQSIQIVLFDELEKDINFKDNKEKVLNYINENFKSKVETINFEKNTGNSNDEFFDSLLNTCQLNI